MNLFQFQPPLLSDYAKKLHEQYEFSHSHSHQSVKISPVLSNTSLTDPSIPTSNILPIAVTNETPDLEITEKVESSNMMSYFSMSCIVLLIVLFFIGYYFFFQSKNQPKKEKMNEEN